MTVVRRPLELQSAAGAGEAFNQSEVLLERGPGEVARAGVGQGEALLGYAEGPPTGPFAREAPARTDHEAIQRGQRQDQLPPAGEPQPVQRS